MAKVPDDETIIIPEYDPYNPKPYPEDIKPNCYRRSEIRKLLKKHKDNRKRSSSSGTCWKFRRKRYEFNA
jgi:hypothetical protein